MTVGFLHQSLADGRWFDLSVIEQMANIGSEVGRAARAKEAGNNSRSWGALERALELFDMTIADDRSRGPRRREICRIRELFCDFMVGDNKYGLSADTLDRYFLPFAVAARQATLARASSGA